MANNINDTVLVLDSAFLQCPINEMIFRGASDEEAISYIQSIAEITKPYDPLCIYLRRQSAEIAIDFAKVVKGEQWAKGIEGMAETNFSDLFNRRFKLEQMLLSSIPSFVCNINGNDWSDAEVKIQRII